MAKVKLFKSIHTSQVNVLNGRYMSLSPKDAKIQNKIHLRENDSITLCGIDTTKDPSFKAMEGYLNEVNCSKCVKVYNKHKLKRK